MNFPNPYSDNQDIFESQAMVREAPLVEDDLDTSSNNKTNLSNIDNDVSTHLEGEHQLMGEMSLGKSNGISENLVDGSNTLDSETFNNASEEVFRPSSQFRNMNSLSPLDQFLEPIWSM